MENDREFRRRITALASAMSGPLVVRNLELSCHEQRVAQAMRIAVESSPRPPLGPSLAEVIEVAGRLIVSDTDDACNSASLDEVQCETLMEVSRRGIEAFIRACGMAMMEQIRSGELEPDWDAMLRRIDQILPRTLHANSVDGSAP